MRVNIFFKPGIAGAVARSIRHMEQDPSYARHEDLAYKAAWLERHNNIEALVQEHARDDAVMRRCVRCGRAAYLADGGTDG